jgi:hypothetical protein
VLEVVSWAPVILRYVLSSDKCSWQEFANSQGTIEQLPALSSYNLVRIPSAGSHGSGVAAKVLGANLGVCKKCTAVWFNGNNILQADAVYYQVPTERVIEHLLNAYQDIKAKNRQGKAVINMSWSYRADQRPAAFFIAIRKSHPLEPA